MHTTEPTIEEIAAALAAVTLYLQPAVAPPPAAPSGSGWADAIKLVQQHQTPIRAGLPVSWRTIERIKRS